MLIFNIVLLGCKPVASTYTTTEYIIHIFLTILNLVSKQLSLRYRLKAYTGYALNQRLKSIYSAQTKPYVVFMNTDLIAYYKNRAKEYESIYLKPERQEELKSSTEFLQRLFEGKSVYEIACGTGFWTEKIAESATSVVATDINKSVIEVAERKLYLKKNVTFEIADIFDLKVKEKCESLFGGFIWSHIQLQDLDKFIVAIHNSVSQGGTVVLMDNNYVEGSNLPITSTDIEGNTFQTRKLEDGSTHLVLKNFPTEEFLRKKLASLATDIQFLQLKYYWMLTYKTLTDNDKL